MTRYFSVSNENFSFPVECENYLVQNGWYLFVLGGKIELAIPPSGWWFAELDEESFSQLLADAEGSDEEDGEEYHVNDIDDDLAVYDYKGEPL